MVMLQRIRRNRIVRIDHLTDAQALALEDDAPGPDRHVAARRELARVRRMIDDLPPRCREIFELRRVEGVSQRERSEEHTSELQSLMRISYAVFCLKKKKKLRVTRQTNNTTQSH